MIYTNRRFEMNIYRKMVKPDKRFAKIGIINV